MGIRQTTGPRLIEAADKARERVSTYPENKKAELETEAQKKVSKAKFDRNRYQRELMQKRRAEEKRKREQLTS